MDDRFWELKNPYKRVAEKLPGANIFSNEPKLKLKRIKKIHIHGLDNGRDFMDLIGRAKDKVMVESKENSPVEGNNEMNKREEKRMNLLDIESLLNSQSSQGSIEMKTVVREDEKKEEGFLNEGEGFERHIIGQKENLESVDDLEKVEDPEPVEVIEDSKKNDVEQYSENYLEEQDKSEESKELKAQISEESLLKEQSDHPDQNQPDPNHPDHVEIPSNEHGVYMVKGLNHEDSRDNLQEMELIQLKEPDIIQDTILQQNPIISKETLQCNDQIESQGNSQNWNTFIEPQEDISDHISPHINTQDHISPHIEISKREKSPEYVEDSEDEPDLLPTNLQNMKVVHSKSFQFEVENNDVIGSRKNLQDKVNELEIVEVEEPEEVDNEQDHKVQEKNEVLREDLNQKGDKVFQDDQILQKDQLDQESQLTQRSQDTEKQIIPKSNSISTNEINSIPTVSDIDVPKNSNTSETQNTTRESHTSTSPQGPQTSISTSKITTNVRKKPFPKRLNGSLASICSKTNTSRSSYRVGLSRRTKIDSLHTYLHKPK
ncbi:hypothetical protein CAAN1_01S14158 [[Candida] anglica]|uniref:Uncharacterized protein n=1 Tax=[Candida] anglica TaxID=148631 RepID=A0ABP0EKR3_9ASCO